MQPRPSAETSRERPSLLFCMCGGSSRESARSLYEPRPCDSIESAASFRIQTLVLPQLHVRGEVGAEIRLHIRAAAAIAHHVQLNELAAARQMRSQRRHSEH